MKSGSKLLYSIGFVFNVIASIILVVAVVIFAVAYSVPQSILESIATDTQHTVEYVREALLIALIVIGVELAVHLALIGVVIYARHSLIKKTGNTTPHIIILLSGIFSFNLFYLIGGILGMVAANNDSEDE